MGWNGWYRVARDLLCVCSPASHMLAGAARLVRRCGGIPPLPPCRRGLLWLATASMTMTLATSLLPLQISPDRAPHLHTVLSILVPAC
jgi:hypothetical protein